MGDNNGPAAILELNEKQAKFLLDNCEKNMRFTLHVMMEQQNMLPRESLERLVDLNEQFKEIRGMLTKQGILLDEI